MADEPVDWSPLMPQEGDPPSTNYAPINESPNLESTPGTPCGGAGDAGKVCDCIECALKATNAAILDVANAIRQKKEDSCNVTDACIDKIWEAIKRKVEGAPYSADKCKQMAASGARGTIEYAVRCAGVAADDCVERCESEGQPINEGKCCKTCGSEKCTCIGGKCLPVKEEEEEKKKKYIGWCHLEDKIVTVTKQGDPPPGMGWSQVALTDTEAAAVELAKANCGKEFEEDEEVKDLEPFGAYHPTCDIDSYFNGQAASDLNAAAYSANLAAGSTQLWQTLGRAGLDGLNLASVGDTLAGLWQTWTGMDPLIADHIMPALASGLGCNLPQFQESAKAIMAISNASKYVGFDPSPWLVPHYYAMNSVCRQKHLSPDEAMAAFLADGKDQFPLDKHFAIAGICKEALAAKLQASRSKPVPLQLAIARRRCLIDETEYAKGMRELGYIDERNPELLFKLTEQVPTMSEIIRFMVRDTDDSNLVSRFKLDTGFDRKYGDQLREWADSQGVTELQAKYNWRAHWAIPSPTALFQFYHRLRYKPEFQGQDGLLNDIKDALVQQDILPYWHDHYLAISFRPMRLVDIRRSFQIGSLKDDELVPAYLDLGYSDDVAEKMAAFTRRLRDRSVASERAVKLWLSGAITRAEATARLAADGVPNAVIERALSEVEPNFDKSIFARAFVRGDLTRPQLIAALSGQGVSDSASNKIADKLAYAITTNPVLEDFEAGTVDRGTAKQAMLVDGMAAEVAERKLDRIEKHVKLTHVKQCVSGIKRRFLTGEFDQQEARNQLIGRGITNQRANQMVDWWGCEIQSDSKDVSASMLCEWFSRGAISSTQFVERLTRIGYSGSDAAMILEDCLIRLNVKAATKAAKEAKEEAANQQRIQRALTSAARQEAAALQRLEANRKAAAKTRQNREKSLLAAAITLTPKCECDTFDALQAVRAASSMVQDQYGLSIERTLQILNLAANELTEGGIPQFVAIAQAMAQTAVESNLGSTEEQLVSAGSSNGVT